MSVPSILNQAEMMVIALSAYQMLYRGSEDRIVVGLTPQHCSAIRAMLQDDNFKAVALDAWNEVFVEREGELYDAVRAAMQECGVWDSFREVCGDKR